MIPCSYQRLNKPRVGHYGGNHHGPQTKHIGPVTTTLARNCDGFGLSSWVNLGGCFGNRQVLTWNQEGTRRHDQLMKLTLDCEGTMPMQARVPNCPRCVCDSPVLGDIVYTSRGSYLVQNAVDEVFLPRSPAPSRFWGSDRPRSSMPHLFSIAKCFACDGYLFLGVFLPCFTS